MSRILFDSFDSQLGPIIVTASMLEAITFTDTPLGVYKTDASIAESFSLQDHVSTTYPIPASMEETLTFLDSNVGLSTLTSQSDETITFTDHNTSHLYAASSILENFNLTDIVNTLSNITVSQTDSITFTDHNSSNSLITADKQEAITFTDVSSSIMRLIGNTEETLLFTDTITNTYNGVALTTDHLVFSEAYTKSITTNSLMEEGITLREYPVEYTAGMGYAFENITFTDSYTAFISAIHIWNGIKLSHTFGEVGADFKLNIGSSTISVPVIPATDDAAGAVRIKPDGVVKALKQASYTALPSFYKDTLTLHDITSAFIIKNATVEDSLIWTDASASTVLIYDGGSSSSIDDRFYDGGTATSTETFFIDGGSA